MIFVEAVPAHLFNMFNSIVFDNMLYQHPYFLWNVEASNDIIPDALFNTIDLTSLASAF